MTTIHRATIKSYTPGTHRASVQVAGSLSVWLEDIPVATNIAAADVVAGRECAVVFFTDDNPADAVVVNIHGAAPGSHSHSRISDGAGTTYMDTTSGVAKIVTQGNDRFILDEGASAANFHAIVAGGLMISERLEAGPNAVGFGAGVPTTYGHAIGGSTGGSTTILTLAANGDVSGSRTGINVSPSWQPTNNSLTYKAITGNAQIGNGGSAAANRTGINGYGLNFQVTYFNLSATKTIQYTDCAAIVAAPAFTVANTTLTINALSGVKVAPSGTWTGATLAVTAFRSFWSNFIGGSSFTDIVGLEIDAFTGGTNRYGIRAADIAGGTIARILELGPATPHLRLEGTGNYAPGVNTATSPLLVLFGNNDNPLTKTLRRIQWKDGATIGAGDRVLIAV